MKVTDQLKIETEIPLNAVNNFQFRWCLDQHAMFKLDGILQSEQADQFIRKNYKGTRLTIEYADEIVFCGIIKETIIKAEGRLYLIEAEAVSASSKLDNKVENEMFQDASLTYRQMICQMVSRNSGEMIGTIGEEAIKKPLLCYNETIWEYANRMSSHFHSHVIADIRTGRPAFWFGLRNGKSIQEHGLSCVQIKIQKALKKGEKDQSFYRLSGSGDYQLCDRILVEGEWQIIYEKVACLRQGEVLFSYLTAREEALYRETKYQEAITGLSLTGTVEKTENEQIYIRLDLDGKQGCYPFPWYPETGNVLYAMPELGAKAELYFMGADERTAIGIRCRDAESEDYDEKCLELPGGAGIIMNDSMIELEKSSKMNLADHKVDLSGNKAIEISASGNVKIEAKIVEVHASDTIDYTTEW